MKKKNRKRHKRRRKWIVYIHKNLEPVLLRLRQENPRFFREILHPTLIALRLNAGRDSLDEHLGDNVYSRYLEGACLIYQIQNETDDTGEVMVADLDFNPRVG